MTKKSRDKRIFNRLKKRYRKTFSDMFSSHKPFVYTQEVFFLDLKFKQKSRDYYRKYPNQILKHYA